MKRSVAGLLILLGLAATAWTCRFLFLDGEATGAFQEQANEPAQQRETQSEDSPDRSLLLVENVQSPDGVVSVRDLLRCRFHQGKPLPNEVVLSADQCFF